VFRTRGEKREKTLGPLAARVEGPAAIVEKGKKKAARFDFLVGKMMDNRADISPKGRARRLSRRRRRAFYCDVLGEKKQKIPSTPARRSFKKKKRRDGVGYRRQDVREAEK